MMKKIQKIIGKILIFAILLNGLSPLSYAANEPELKEPEKACADKKPDYKAMKEEWGKLKTKNRKAYDKAFEKAQEAHHNYVGCMFDFAEKTIEEKFVQGDQSNWNAPDQACLKPDEIKTIIQKTEPSQMLAPMLNSHTAYKNYLKEISDDFLTGEQTDENDKAMTLGEALVESKKNFSEIGRQKELEIISSLFAMDMAFTSLKEMRLSVVMHIHFQCSLKYLEKYRKSLSNLRKLIDALPSQLRDASVVK